ncbi:MAG: hypothetical protein K2W96_14725, partial [Gemmataceae bacterium]|nr:hypothetical protein [Gemmataceae bacterium]
FYLRRSSDAAGVAREAERLVERLGDDSFDARKDAARKLEALGAAALPVLKKHAKAKSPEVRNAIKRLLPLAEDRELSERNLVAPLSRAVIRLLVREKHPEAASAILAYLPFSDHEATEEEVYYALDELRPWPLLARMMADKAPERRAVAACLFGKSGDARHRMMAKRCLSDPSPLVRLRAAQGLLAAKVPFKGTLPVLIGLLRGNSVAVAWQAEELLRYAVGKGPKETVGANTPKEQERCQAAWRAWWEENGKGVDLAGLRESGRRPGLVLLTLSTFAKWKGKLDKNGSPPARFQLYGCDGVPRWSLTLPDARLRTVWHPAGGICIGGYCHEKGPDKNWVVVSLFDLEGKELWRRNVSERSGSLGLALAPGGRVFTWSRTWIAEVGGKGELLRKATFGAWGGDGQRLGPDGRMLWGEGLHPPDTDDPKTRPEGILMSLKAADVWRDENPVRTTFDCRVHDEGRDWWCGADGGYFARATWPEPVIEYDSHLKRVRTFDIRPLHLSRLRDGTLLCATDATLKRIDFSF